MQRPESGTFLVLAGLYIGYYGVYELSLFHADGSAEDPIVEGASKLQALARRRARKHSRVSPDDVSA